MLMGIKYPITRTIKIDIDIDSPIKRIDNVSVYCVTLLL
jgi:hypothetical protein